VTSVRGAHWPAHTTAGLLVTGEVAITLEAVVVGDVMVGSDVEAIREPLGPL